MKTKLMLWSGVGLGLVGAAGATWLLSLPPAPAKSVPPAIGKDEADAILAGLKPPKRARPVIAIVGINHATELTDYLMPYGILRRANLADVMLLSTERGRWGCFPHSGWSARAPKSSRRPGCSMASGRRRIGIT